MYTREISDYSGFMFLAFMYLLAKLINHLLSRMILQVIMVIPLLGHIPSGKLN